MTDRPDTHDVFPDIALEKPDGGKISASDLRGRPAVLFFYPKDNTPGCTAVATDFTALRSRFDAAGAALLGISKDPPASHRKFIEKRALAVDLASDAPADAEQQGLAEALGIWVEKNMYGRKYMGMERTTYLLDAEGRIARVWRKVKVKRHVEEVLEAVEALRAKPA